MKSTKKFAACLFLVFCLAVTVSIDIPQLNLVSTVQAASKVKISKTKASLEKGSTLQLKISGTKKKVQWSTSSSKIATVNSKGKVTAKKAGTATITAKVDGKKYRCKITVTTPAISKKTLKLTVKDTYTLKMTGTKKSVKWSSSKSSVASVNAKGKVTAKKAGTATITAKVGGKKYTCKVTVVKKPAFASGYQKLNQYITKYGSLNANGNKFISASDYVEGMDITWGIEYDSKKKQYHFIMSTEYYYGDFAISMYVNAADLQYVRPNCLVVIGDGLGAFMSEAQIVPAKYNGKSNVAFTIKNTSGGISSAQVNQLSNASLQMAFVGWEGYLLRTKVGISMKDLGFTSFSI